MDLLLLETDEVEVGVVGESEDFRLELMELMEVKRGMVGSDDQEGRTIQRLSVGWRIVGEEKGGKKMVKVVSKNVEGREKRGAGRLVVGWWRWPYVPASMSLPTVARWRIDCLELLEECWQS
jgi:hypothetical protein